MVAGIFETLTSSAYWESAIRLTVPILLAALGALIAGRAGVLFVGVEGVMLASTFASVAAAAKTGSITTGVLAGLGAGILAGLIVAWVSIDLRAGDVVAGLVAAVGALGVTSFLLKRWFPAGAYLSNARLEAPWKVNGSGGLWFLLDQNPLAYLAIVVVVAIPLVLRTRAGLRLRACGEAMDVAAGHGISVRRMRYVASGLAGALAGLAGTSLGLAVVGSFDGNPVAGRGFIALACVILGAWRAKWVALAALFFAGTDAFRFQAHIAGSGTWGPVLPYVATLVALATLQQRRTSTTPRDIGRAIELPVASANP